MSDLDVQLRQLADKYLQRAGNDDSSELHKALKTIVDTIKPTVHDTGWNEYSHFLAGATDEDGDDIVMLYGRDDDDKILVTLPRSSEDNGVWRSNSWDLTPNEKRYELREVGKTDTLVKTFGEYSREEQTEMIGMWAERNDQPGLTIILGEVNKENRVPCYDPTDFETKYWEVSPSLLIPRSDLPQACSINEVEALKNDNKPVQRTHPDALFTLEEFDNAPEGTIVSQNDESLWMKNNNMWVGEEKLYTSHDMVELRSMGDLIVDRWGL